MTDPAGSGARGRTAPMEACLFAGNPLDRASEKRTDPDFIAAALAAQDSALCVFFKGDPLLRREGGALRTLWVSTAACQELPHDAPIVFLGLKDGAAYFAADASRAPSPDAAPFSDLGAYTSLRDAAAEMEGASMAVLGQARWLLDWHRRHQHCAVCGAPTAMAEGGAKRRCGACDAEHFPRTDPVSIVLAVHGDACLLGRSPHFPPGYYSALAGYVEAAETPEECAVRELHEEAGVRLSNVRYLFSQPWPFPSSLMMGFLAEADSRALTLDTTEVAEAVWLDRGEARALTAGAVREDLRLPPRFTIARRLIETWASGAEPGPAP